MKTYLSDISEVFAHAQSSPGGLRLDEAARRLEQNGRNKLAEGKKESLIKRIFQQMLDPMILILLAAAAVSAGLAIYQGVVKGHLEEPPYDIAIILSVVIINAILGVYQESKAEAAIAALQEMAAATSRVLRDGEIRQIRSEELVVGDVILLEAGDAVPADARVFESASLKIEEAALTGESVPVSKLIQKLLPQQNGDVALGDRKNMVYMGSTVSYGRGRAVITATGMDTEMGKIASALAKAEEGETPLQIKLNQLSKILTWLVLGICVFIFGFSCIRNYLNPTIDGFGGIETLLQVFMLAVSLAVAAIPEGLAAVVTIVLSIGVTNMSRKKAIIRKLTAVETLGCAQIICSDKTGTLTQNKMTVVEHTGTNENGLAAALALCSDAEYSESSGAVGDPTEVALVVYADGLGLPKAGLKETYPRIGEAPFDSMRKMMSTVHQAADGTVRQYTKGAPDEVLKHCVAMEDEAGRTVPLTEELRGKILADNKAMADKALRVLAAARRDHAAAPADFEPETLEQDLIYLGLVGMIDPVRPEVKDAIAECRNAGIRPIMITGDHRDTAVAIATELGILDGSVKAITGAELGAIDDATFERTVEDYAVYARVQPEHKVRIVNAWRTRGMVTAMTGDGVNDAPSIKSADIGVGMGITGTDVTKNVADMVLADDNFATIVSAVGEGRRIYDNIRKAIQFLLGSNLSEVLSIFFASLLNVIVLQPVHLLWINLVTDCFPALALGMEKSEHDIMRRSPRKAKDGIFAGGVGIDLLYQGAFVSLLTLAAFFIGEHLQAVREHAVFHFTNLDANAGAEGMTMAFLTMSMCEIFHSFNMRSQRGSVITMARKSGMNWWLWGSMVLSLPLSSVVVLVPQLRDIFGFAEHFSLMEYGISMALAFSIVPLVEIVKFFQRLAERRNA
ncbi:MAG: cation-translocating P-type ATPase [Oscillospiraceae bacterium]|jgi:Ca2+-transporting ATPase|nr:cation-translocating P-type ATPase [Oscillospiraceae bacterium]